MSDPTTEKSLHDVPAQCEFARLDAGITRLPTDSAILRFRHRLEDSNLSIQILTTINAAIASKGLMLKTVTTVDTA